MKKFDITQTSEFKSAQQFSKAHGIPMHPLVKPETTSENSPVPSFDKPTLGLKFEKTLPVVTQGSHLLEVVKHDYTTEPLDDLPENAVKRFIPTAPVHPRATIGAFIFTTEYGQGVILPGDKGDTVWLRAPIVITKIFEGEYDKQEEKLELAFYDAVNQRWKRVIVPRVMLTSIRTITNLSKYGYPVTNDGKGEKNEARRLMHFLQFYEMQNFQSINHTPITDQMGWYDEDGEIVGFVPYLERVTLDPAGPGEKKLLKHGFVSKGTDVQNYIERMKEILQEYPVPIFVYSLAYAAPLLKLIGAPSFSVELASSSGFGKSLCQQLMMNVWGNPDVLVMDFDATNAGFEQLLKFTNDLPKAFQDAQNNENDTQITQFIYRVFSGTGRTRANYDGGNQETAMFRGIFTSSSEANTDARINRDGTRRRLVTLTELPFPTEEDAKIAGRKAQELHETCYGLAGRMWVSFLLQNRSNWQGWKRQYINTIDYLDDKVDKTYCNPISKKNMKDQNRLLATVVIALNLMNACFDFKFDVNKVMNSIIQAVYEHLDKNTIPIRALASIVNFALSNWRSHFHPDSTTGKLLGVIRPNKYIAIRKETTEYLLKQYGYNTSVIQDWKALGILNVEKDGGITPKTPTKPNQTQRMLQLNWSKLGQYLGNDFCTSTDILDSPDLQVSVTKADDGAGFNVRISEIPGADLTN
ncbi:DUF927 domain-containing protein [Brevibacillus thermoruber]|uniref:DUF927 domain-containing protein n=1 Tax=Brevibacillus thermoruber TaxID=33942 RepID=UPI00055015B8|nr:DUF927 domain-containing protein [Brevibacillus thermoruber]